MSKNILGASVSPTYMNMELNPSKFVSICGTTINIESVSSSINDSKELMLVNQRIYGKLYPNPPPFYKGGDDHMKPY